MEKIAVVILTHRRIQALERCLNSLIAARDFECCEIIIVIDDYDNRTDAFVRKNYGQFSNIASYVLAKGSRSRNRNYAIEKTDADILYFLDDDLTVGKDNLAVIRKKFKEYGDIQILGGPNLTPEKSSFFQRCQGYVLSSMFATAWISQRYKKLSTDKLTDERGLILCNLAIKKSILSENNLHFEEQLVSNEETLLLQKLKQRGYKALYAPELIVYHERRKDLWQFFLQIVSYGRGRCQNIKYFPQSFSVVYIIPGVFLIYLLSLLIYRESIYLLPFYVYLLINSVFSFWIGIKERSFVLPLAMFFLHPFVHLAYGLGCILELFRLR